MTEQETVPDKLVEETLRFLWPDADSQAAADLNDMTFLRTRLRNLAEQGDPAAVSLLAQWEERWRREQEWRGARLQEPEAPKPR